MLKLSEELYHIPARAARTGGIQNFDSNDVHLLPRLGSRIDPEQLEKMCAIRDQARRMVAQDSLQPAITSPSISTPIQFLQEFAPGHVRILTAARRIDEITGLSTIGRYEDEEVVQGVLELLGVPQPYGDYTNVALADWNNTWERRTIVRFELGMEVKKLEMLRAAAMNLDSGAEKRNSATLQLDIARNNVGFNGYNNGANMTYGFLNDPGLPSYITVPNGASGSPHWSQKTTLEIIQDILNGIAQLVTNSQDVIDPLRTEMTLACATSVRQYLNVVTTLGYSVQEWIDKNYPTLRVISAPQLDNANGGANVFYIFAEKVEDGSTDDRRTWLQAVPTKFMVLGVQQETNGYKEDYTNATAGQMLKRPFAVYRASGV